MTGPTRPFVGLEAKDIWKWYGGTFPVLGGVDFTIEFGEIVGLVGANGAGKSTLLKILSGAEKAERGHVMIEGLHATRIDVAVAHQEFSLAPNLTVAQNLAVGNPSLPRFRTRRSLNRWAGGHLESVGIGDIDPTTLVSGLSIAERHLVELTRMLSRNARIMLVDEPTAALSEVEAHRVLQLLRDLTHRGAGVCLVTHRLDEIKQFTDRVTVLRDGLAQGTYLTPDIGMDEVVEKMLGKAPKALYPPRATRSSQSPPRVELRSVQCRGLVEEVSLTIHRGEIVGLAGDVGSGVDAIIDLLVGDRLATIGTVHLDGQPLVLKSRRDAVRAGIGYCSADRKLDGIFAMRPVRENLMAPNLGGPNGQVLVGTRRESKAARDIAGHWKIADRVLTLPADALSGGNQQKVALGKWTSGPLRLLVVKEPTRGVDVGARAEIYRHVRELAEEGLSVIFTSLALEEVVGWADTVVTFFAGRMVRQDRAENLTVQRVLQDITLGGEATFMTPGGADA